MMQNYKNKSQTNPLVAVIIPFYNSNDTINRALNSVLKQTYQNFEIVVCIDQNSEDPEIASNDARIRIVRNNETPGAGMARFVAINSTSCRYLAFLDADDEWIDQKLEQQVHYMNENKLIFSCTGYCTIKCGNRLATYVPKGILNYRSFLLKKIIVCCSSVIIDTKYNVPIIEPHLRKRNDYQMWYPILIFAMKYNYRCGYLSEVMTIRHIHENNLTKNKLILPYYNFQLYENIFGSKPKALLYTVLNTLNTLISKLTSFSLR